MYILASKRRDTLHIGVTSDLKRRVYQHKQDLIEGFTKKYRIHTLVYYKQTSDVYTAIQREKQLKNWRREWKINLIEKENSQWKDLYRNL